MKETTRSLLYEWHGVNESGISAKERTERRKLADWLARELFREGLAVVRLPKVARP